MDITAELQHRIRLLEHDVANERSKFQNEKLLRQRDACDARAAIEALPVRYAQGDPRRSVEVIDRDAVLAALPRVSS